MSELFKKTISNYEQTYRREKKVALDRRFEETATRIRSYFQRTETETVRDVEPRRKAFQIRFGDKEAPEFHYADIPSEHGGVAVYAVFNNQLQSGRKEAGLSLKIVDQEGIVHVEKLVDLRHKASDLPEHDTDDFKEISNILNRISEHLDTLDVELGQNKEQQAGAA